MKNTCAPVCLGLMSCGMPQLCRSNSNKSFRLSFQQQGTQLLPPAFSSRTKQEDDPMKGALAWLIGIPIPIIIILYLVDVF
ncbi:MAG: hypothetical protein JXR75_01325 [Rhodobacteraceae bacterium]|nr:hypothetical protein [Paracoccaceae bacterium]